MLFGQSQMFNLNCYCVALRNGRQGATAVGVNMFALIAQLRDRFPDGGRALLLSIL